MHSIPFQSCALPWIQSESDDATHSLYCNLNNQRPQLQLQLQLQLLVLVLTRVYIIKYNLGLGTEVHCLASQIADKLALCPSSSQFFEMGAPLAHMNGNIPTTRRASRVTQVLLVFLCLCLSSFIGRQFYTINFRLDVQRRTELPRFYKCKPPLPNLLQKRPPALNEYPSLRWAAIKLDAQLAARAALPGTDSLVITVVTPAGVLWSKGYGRRHANDTGNTASPDLDTSYRIASISKMFATLETLILRERGALNLYVNLMFHNPRLIGTAGTTQSSSSCLISLIEPSGGKNT